MAWIPVSIIDAYAVSAPAGADGICDAIFDEVPGGRVWRLETINVSSTSTAVPDALIYIGDPMPQFLRAGSNSGLQDTGEGVLYVPAGHYLRIRWVGADPGSIGAAAIQGQLLEQVAGREAHPLFGR